MTPPELNWNDVKFFLAVARAANLTRAARSLKVSQPTVGRRLKVLESSLATRLFDRRTGELSLTPAGRKLLPLAERMEAESFDLARAVVEQSAAEDEPLRVTAIGSVALFLTNHFLEIRAQDETLEVEIISTGERLSLARNEADIALRMGRIPRSGNLVTRRIGRVAFSLYASRGYIKRSRLRTEDDIRTADFVGFKKNPKRPSQSRWLYDYGRAGRFPLRVNELHLRYDAALQGLGVTLLPCHLADRSRDLRRLIPPPPDLVEDVYLLIHADMRNVPRVKAGAGILAGLFKTYRDELMGAG